MRNRFENIFGKLFRAYAKSMIEEISKLPFEGKELLSIGVLQYSPYDDSFRYAPTLRNIFIVPDKVANNFPTSKTFLWNYNLMICLAKYLFKIKKSGWIEDIFRENKELAENKASIFNASYNNYKYIRQSWEDWYKQHIDEFGTLEEVADKLKLNQLFYFANFLITIAKWPAFINKNPKTFADIIYTWINRYDLSEKFPNINIMDRRRAYINNCIHNRWRVDINGQIYKAELLYVLEICFKQPFSVDQKIEMINKVTNHREFGGNYHINATARPIIAAGEFLGISYIAWPSKNENESQDSYQKINDRINDVFQASRIEDFLFKSRVATTRFYLQEINSENIQDSTIYRLFKLTHIFSSSHLVAYFDEQDVYFRFVTKNGNNSKYKDVKHDKTKQDFVEFLSKNVGKTIKELQQHASLWIDITKEEIECENSNDFYNKIKNDIESFNTNLKDYILDNDYNKKPSYQITNITFHNFMFEGKRCGLVFFNSNFFPIFNYDKPTPKLLKQNYAYEIYNSLSELIEDEHIHRVNYEQEQKFLMDMKLGFVHHIKGIVQQRLDIVKSTTLNNDEKIKKMEEIDKLLVADMNNYLEIFKNDVDDELSISNDVVSVWNKIGESSKIVKICNFKDSNLRFKGSKKIIEMILKELIENGVKYDTKTMSLNITRHDNLVKLSIFNEGSTIPTQKRNIIGKKLISDTSGSGIGYYFIQSALERMKAIENPNKKGTHFEIYCNEFSFEFIFKILLI